MALALSVAVIAGTQEDNGLRLWALGLSFNCTAYVLWGLTDFCEGLHAIPTAQTIITLSYAAFNLAVCKFLKRKISLWFTILPPLVTFIGCMIFNNSLILPVLLVNSVLFLQAMGVIIMLSQAHIPYASRGRLLTQAGISIIVLTDLIRVIIQLKAPLGIQHTPLAKDLELILMILPTFFAVTTTAGFILMNKESSDVLLRSVALRDRLTQCWNRVRIDEVAEQELARLERYGHPVTLIIADIDFFKKVNDTYGHQAGDDVLRDFAEISRETLRTTDFLGRWGGEEFIAILPSTSFSDATRIAERWRENLAQHTCPHGEPVTASFGIATARSTDNWADWLERADQALYTAKDAGRNCCKFENIEIVPRSEDTPGMTPAQIRWSAEYETGSEQIDLQHREIIRQVNTLLHMEDIADIYPLVLHILEMTRHHFSCEISHLEQEQSPQAVQNHKDFHDYLLQRAESLLRKTRQGEAEPEPLIHFIVFELVVQHMLGEDIKVMPGASPDVKVIAA